MAVKFVLASSQTIAFGSGSTAGANTSGATLCAWYWPVTLTAGTKSIFGFSNGVSATATRAKFGSDGTSIRANGRCKDADGNQAFVGASGRLSTGKWQHLAAVFDYPNKVIRLYVNGSLTDTSGVLAWGASPTSNTASVSMNIGSQHSGGAEYVDGYIEDARAYDRQLSLAEIQTIYYSVGADQVTYGLKHRYLLRENYPGTTVSDSAGAVKDMGELQKNNASQANNPTYQDGYVSELAILHAL